MRISYSYVKRFKNDFLVQGPRRYYWRGVTITTIILTLWLFICYFPSKYPPGFNDCSVDINRKNARKLSIKRINLFSNEYFSDKTNRSRNNKNVDRYDSVHLLRESECVDMGTSMERLKSLKICIYNPAKDLIVSRHLKEYGTWEKENVVEMLKAFDNNLPMTLVDLGSNVGVFTLQAAATGHEVISVDALLSNHLLLSRSLVLNDLSCNVTLIHNAVHGRRRQKMRITVNPSNIGGSVISNIPDFRRDKIPLSQQIDAICLDDLAPLVFGKDVFLKMDLEGSELDALSCAHEFFTQANVKVFLMEWQNYRHNARASKIIKRFLTSHHMVPTWGVDRDRTIDVDASHAWPDNVFWMKKDE